MPIPFFSLPRGPSHPGRRGRGAQGEQRRGRGAAFQFAISRARPGHTSCCCSWDRAQHQHQHQLRLKAKSAQTGDVYQPWGQASAPQAASLWSWRKTGLQRARQPGGRAGGTRAGVPGIPGPMRRELCRAIGLGCAQLLGKALTWTGVV